MPRQRDGSLLPAVRQGEKAMTPLITRLLKLLIICVTIVVVIGLLRSSLCEAHIRRGNLEIKAILTCQS